jgi:hypothetical protein
MKSTIHSEHSVKQTDLDIVAYQQLANRAAMEGAFELIWSRKGRLMDLRPRPAGTTGD